MSRPSALVFTTDATPRKTDMPLFSPEWFSALLAIVLIDLILAGDNAIVIALAARGLPAHLQRKAIVWGTVGAIGIRALMTLVVVWLLKIPGLMLVGGLGLVWIAYKLLVPGDSSDSNTRVMADRPDGARKARCPRSRSVTASSRAWWVSRPWRP